MRVLSVIGDLMENNSLGGVMLFNGHHLEQVASGHAGLELAAKSEFDAAIIDIDLSDTCGISLCKVLRARSDISIVLISSKKSLVDCLAAFEAGADDFLVSPLAVNELLARLEAIVSRRQVRPSRVLKVADLYFNLDTLEVNRGGMPLKLNPISLKLLELMMKRSPGIVDRKELEKNVWGRDEVSGDSLRTNMYLLRKGVDKGFDKPLIHTVYSYGYRITG